MHRAPLSRTGAEGRAIMAERSSLAPRRQQTSRVSLEFRRRVRISGIVTWLGPLVILAKKRCVTCHSENPTHTMFLNQPPPKDLAFGSIDEVRKAADRIMVQVVRLERMPLGNETAMEDEERAKFDAWITATESAAR
jgi:uncharacterized membrane protein